MLMRRNVKELKNSPSAGDDGCELIEDQEDEKDGRKNLNAYVINKKCPKEVRVLPPSQQNVKQIALTGRFARSKSPRNEGNGLGIAPSHPNSPRINEGFRHVPRRLSPQGPNTRPVNSPLSKFGDLTMYDNTNSSSPGAHDNDLKNPREFKITTNRGQDRLAATARRLDNSPRGSPSPPPNKKTEQKKEISKEEQILKEFARRQRQLNEDLWEAASNGDIIKIARLLEP
jgi:hypothetical protein